MLGREVALWIQGRQVEEREGKHPVPQRATVSAPMGKTMNSTRFSSQG